jgi:uncharacterized protein (TIGR04222 family)
VDNPWGISGPAFIWGYIALLAAPLILRALRHAAAKRSPVPRQTQAYVKPLTVYHLAYLAGGPYRTVETVITAMVERGQLRASSDKRLKTVGSAPADPLERAVGNATNASFASTTATVQHSVRCSAEMGELAADLESQGLEVPRSTITSVGRTVFLAYLAVLAIGIARWVTGAALNRPVGVLSALVILAFVIMLAAGSIAKRDPRSIPTTAGKRVLAQARAENAPPSRRRGRATTASPGLPPGAVLAGAAGVVALGGLAMHPDPELSAVLMPPPTSGGGGGSSSGDSGGSSCGGGGCGGGGCGG